MSGLFRKTGGAITGVVTSFGWDVKEWEPKKKGGEGYSTLTAVLGIKPDGADQSIERYINAGFFYPDTMAIEDNVIQCNEDAPPVRENTDFGRLVGTLIEKGFPENRLTPQDFRPIVGTRLTLVNKIDEEATKKFGKRKAKDGKEYNRDYPVVEAVLALPEAQKTTGRKNGAAAAGKATPAKATARGKTPPPPAADTDPESGDELMVTLLSAAKGNTLAKGRVSGALVKHQLNEQSGMTREQRDVWRDYLISEDYLDGIADRGVVSYDEDTETFGLA